MSGITKIALTGGPCGGKSTAIKILKSKLTEYGFDVFTVSETATELIKSGKTPESLGTYGFHSLLFKTQLQKERRAEVLAEKSERSVVICDRGLLDSRAYVSAEDFARYSAEEGLSEAYIRASYNAVFHLVTAADGAEEFYDLKNNLARSETPKQAREKDFAVMSVWVGTPHLRVIDNSTDFQGKLDRLQKEVEAVLGIPKPLEIERKFLIERPDTELLESMKLCRKISISQSYMNIPDEGRFRIRKRGEGSSSVYIKTVKKKLTEIKRIELEEYISKNEYYEYLSQKESVVSNIKKDRYCLLYKSKYFELDIFPFWDDKALLEIELLDEDEEFDLPDFARLISEVSYDRSFRNSSLAKQYGEK